MTTTETPPVPPGLPPQLPSYLGGAVHFLDSTCGDWRMWRCCQQRVNRGPALHAALPQNFPVRSL